ncbi:hypothetical protein PROH_10070 [Prochlorothrix hollandica PCC 9006 = CALU 1027]|uniref:Uncharacterized protein n=1 Tax=Prochlorothrix hollandica PCC 9006 = CALU 1027 TaxID=317619 RepID=A0A0M2Q0B3_PROHO|nr:hypothetical protein PROH_10070 [Prochlorothrix hollandica PCC 9006 = CALU 1027]
MGIHSSFTPQKLIAIRSELSLRIAVNQGHLGQDTAIDGGERSLGDRKLQILPHPRPMKPQHQRSIGLDLNRSGTAETDHNDLLGVCAPLPR